MVIKFLHALPWFELMWKMAWREKSLHKALHQLSSRQQSNISRQGPATDTISSRKWRDTSGFHSFCGISPRRGKRENVPAAGKKTPNNFTYWVQDFQPRMASASTWEKLMVFSLHLLRVPLTFSFVKKWGLSNKCGAMLWLSHYRLGTCIIIWDFSAPEGSSLSIHT